MAEQVVKTEHFLALHHGSGPLLLPNAWDRGSAALLTALGDCAGWDWPALRPAA